MDLVSRPLLSPYLVILNSSRSLYLKTEITKARFLTLTYVSIHMRYLNEHIFEYQNNAGTTASVT